MGVGGEGHVPANLPRERDPVPILQEAGWAALSVWAGEENRNLRGFDPRTVQANRVAIPTELSQSTLKATRVLNMTLYVATQGVEIQNQVPFERPQYTVVRVKFQASVALRGNVQ
jgi:hypothetical protein